MDQIIEKLIGLKPKDHDDLSQIKRRLCKESGFSSIKNADILKYYQAQIRSGRRQRDDRFEKLIRKRAIRTLSGIAPVAVLTMPFACPGHCAYCPTEKNVPQSYLSNEPAVMRAIRCGYDPYAQVRLRLRALENNGHHPTKIELIVIGGTWSVLPEGYKYWFISQCFKAANEFEGKGKKILDIGNLILNGAHQISNIKYQISKPRLDALKRELQIQQKRNESAKYQIIGVTLETRPDYIDHCELLQMRELGCTRVELGVQAIDDEILKKNKRGHAVKEIVRSTALLKNFGFKVTYHFMPGLPGSTPAQDFNMFKKLFTEESYQPDQIKFYPCVVTKGSLLYRWWKTGKYKPYSAKQLTGLIAKCKAIVPRYVRIIRLIRDIPGESILAGNTVTNLRQVLQQQGVKCDCIRCREAGELKAYKFIKLKVTEYPSSGGVEYFIEATNREERVLFGFCRLRLVNSKQKTVNSKDKLIERVHSPEPSVLQEAAIIRELHIYGELNPVGSGQKKIQHSGLGKRLMREAEKIAQEKGYEKIAVIAGVGVRGYYRKLGYRLKDTYMIRSI